MSLFTGMGVSAVVIVQLFRGRDVGLIAEGYVKVAGRMSQVFRKSVPVRAEAFSIGERQFIVDPEYATTAESWNHWGGNHPVVRYYIDDSRPMSNSFAEQKFKVLGKKDKIEKDAIRPERLDLERHPKPSSGTVNLIIRRKGAAIMIEATKKVAMNPWVAAFAGAAVASMVVYFALNLYHPGLVGAPPPGYYFKVEPIPANATVVH